MEAAIEATQQALDAKGVSGHSPSSCRATTNPVLTFCLAYFKCSCSGSQ